jgi:hypothetical protein
MHPNWDFWYLFVHFHTMSTKSLYNLIYVIKILWLYLHVIYSKFSLTSHEKVSKYFALIWGPVSSPVNGYCRQSLPTSSTRAGLTDWANFSPFGRLLTLEICFEKYWMSPSYWVALLEKSYELTLTIYGLGHKLGLFLYIKNPVTLYESDPHSWGT